ncbi:hypothetical protein P7C70_g1449, partial [Phenoliferia sp. Uapishka_3]
MSLTSEATSGLDESLPEDVRHSEPHPLRHLTTPPPFLQRFSLLIVTLPLEILENIRAQLFEGLDEVDEQLQRYRAIFVCRAFTNFFATQKPCEYGLHVSDGSRAVALTRAIRLNGRTCPTALSIHMSDEGEVEVKDLEKSVAELLRECSESLQNLHLLTPDESSYESDRVVQEALAELRNLKKFKLSGPHWSDSFGPTLACWSHLEELFIACPDCPLWDYDIPENPIIPFRLRTLTLSPNSETPEPLLLAIQDAAGPQLKRLSLKGWHKYSSVLDLHRFLEATFPHLNHFFFNGSNSPYLRALLASASRLRTLRLNASSVAPKDKDPVWLFEVLEGLRLLEHFRLSISVSTPWLKAGDFVAYFGSGGCKHLRKLTISMKPTFFGRGRVPNWQEGETREVEVGAQAAGVRVLDLSEVDLYALGSDA